MKANSKKPRFRVGQVVMIDDHGFYGRIKTVYDDQTYELQTDPSDNAGIYEEANLRPLTKREIGQGRRRRKV